MEETTIISETEVITDVGENNILSYIGSEAFWLSVVVLAIIIFELILIGKIFKHFQKQHENKHPDENEKNPEKVMMIHVISGVLKGVVIVVGVIFILQCNGVQVTALITSAGILSAIIGLALQDAIKDIIQGIHIIGDQYFSVGDVIHYNGIDGKVLKVTLRMTRIRDINNNNIITISNRNIATAEKLSHQHDIDLGLSYEDDSDHVMSVLEKICEKIDELEGVESCRLKGIQSFEESCIIYKIRMFSKPEQMPQLHRDAMKIIRNGLQNAGIEVPFNQMDIHLSRESHT